jgi:16S rRNA (cytosine967-C5)-methyltransferase
VSTQSPREIAFRVLQRREHTRRHVEDLLADELDRAALPSADRSLAQELTYGIVRWEATLDWLIGRKTSKSATNPVSRLLLRLGLYQLFWLSRIPGHAAVNETVEMSKGAGDAVSPGFINAVLRAYIRESEATRSHIRDLKTNQPALGFSHPEWLYERWENRWGRHNAMALMDWNNQAPAIFARVNTLRVHPAQLLEQWKKEQVQFEPFERDWTGAGLIYRLVCHPALRQFESFKRGFFYVQDPSTLLSVSMLDVRPGLNTLDLCAAPGGKTTYIAQLLDNQGRVAARDSEPERLDMLRSNCSRLGVTCADISLARLARNDAEPLGPGENFDRILVDAPCSNTGVIRRRVELRWRLKPREIARLAGSQLELLDAAAAKLVHGGILVYSTCSIEPEENQQVSISFLERNNAFKLSAERELTPFHDGVDGAYVARFTKE